MRTNDGVVALVYNFHMTTQPQILSDVAWREIESVVAEISALASQDIPFSALASQLLEKTSSIVMALGGAVWLLDGDGLHLQSQIGLEPLIDPWQESHAGQLRGLALAGAAATIPPSAEITKNDLVVSNGAEAHWMVHPLVLEGKAVGVVELFHRPAVNAAAIAGSNRLVAIACEAAIEHLKRAKLRELMRGQSESKSFANYVDRIHQTLDFKETAFVVANEAKLFLGCDRIAVVVRRGRHYRVAAVSGIDSVNRRAKTVRQLERLAAAVGRINEPLWYAGKPLDLPPQIQRELDGYLDQANPRLLGLVPLPHPSSDLVGGVLVVERFDLIQDAEMGRRAELAARHAAQALRNATNYQRLPTLPFARSVRGTRFSTQQGVFGAAICAALLTLLLLVLLLVRVPFEIASEGELRPVRQFDVFAAVNGEVVDLKVDHNTAVNEGAVLAVLKSAELDIQLEEAKGKLNTMRKRLLAVESTLLQYEPNDRQNPLGRERLAAEHEELKLAIASQQRQVDMLSRQQDQLIVRSPIKGSILTWNLQQLLGDRPVERGQALMTVADLQGSWQAELQIPDDRIGYVLDAWQSGSTPLTASFELETNPGVRYQGSVQQVSNRVETTDRVQTVRAILKIDQADLPTLRAGTTINARIDCGRKSIAYVWFHDIYDTIRKWILF